MKKETDTSKMNVYEGSEVEKYDIAYNQALQNILELLDGK